MFDQTIESKLLFAKNAITNSLNISKITEALNVYGYGEKKLNIGLKKYQTTEELHIAKGKEYGEKTAATDALRLSKAIANKAYVRDIKIARIAVEGMRDTEESLLLRGRRKESLSGWLNQAKTFYTNALLSNDILVALSVYNITKDKLLANQALVADVELKFSQQLKEKGEAQSATAKRDKSFDDLQEWVSNFVAIARIALEDMPQYLEMLGIIEPSE